MYIPLFDYALDTCIKEIKGMNLKFNSSAELSQYIINNLLDLEYFDYFDPTGLEKYSVGERLSEVYRDMYGEYGKVAKTLKDFFPYGRYHTTIENCFKSFIASVIAKRMVENHSINNDMSEIINPEFIQDLILARNITQWIKKYAFDNNIETLVVGISGGIDSSAVAHLCASTGIKTILVHMPYNSPILPNVEELLYSRVHWDNVKFLCKDITAVYQEYEKLFPNTSKLTKANTLARIRMTTLYAIAGDNRGIVVGTGNKIEDFGVGFFTKYGDGGVDISPIGDLLKSEVRRLGYALGVPESIIKAPPTDGLWEDGRTDEDQIGASYDELEWAMGMSKRQAEVLEIYNKFRENNAHKMSPIPVYLKTKIDNNE